MKHHAKAMEDARILCVFLVRVIVRSIIYDRTMQRIRSFLRVSQFPEQQGLQSSLLAAETLVQPAKAVLPRLFVFFNMIPVPQRKAPANASGHTHTTHVFVELRVSLTKAFYCNFRGP